MRVGNASLLPTLLSYLGYKPVKPSDVNPVSNWKYSSFHRWVARGIYPMDWATHNNNVIDMAFE